MLTLTAWIIHFLSAARRKTASCVAAIGGRLRHLRYTGLHAHAKSASPCTSIGPKVSDSSGGKDRAQLTIADRPKTTAVPVEKSRASSEKRSIPLAHLSERASDAKESKTVRTAAMSFTVNRCEGARQAAPEIDSAIAVRITRFVRNFAAWRIRGGRLIKRGIRNMSTRKARHDRRGVRHSSRIVTLGAPDLPNGARPSGAMPRLTGGDASHRRVVEYPRQPRVLVLMHLQLPTLQCVQPNKLFPFGALVLGQDVVCADLKNGQVSGNTQVDKGSSLRIDSS